MDTAFKQLPEVARTLGVTVDQCRYWLMLLGIIISHQGRVRVVSEDVVEMLGKVAELVKAGVAPKNACMAVKAEITEATVLPEKRSVTGLPIGDVNIINLQLEEIKKAMVLLAEQTQKTQAEIIGLRRENTLLKTYLMPPKEQPKPINVWKPEPVKDPLEGVNLLRRVWIELFEPWKMRRYATSELT